MIIENKKILINLLQENSEKIKSFGVNRLGLFGSFVRDKQNKNSDVDILVEFEKGKKNFDNFMGLSFLLEELTERKVELLTPKSLSPYIGPHILKEVEYVPFSS